MTMDEKMDDEKFLQRSSSEASEGEALRYHLLLMRTVLLLLAVSHCRASAAQ